jgi:hypothetical protein
MQEIADKKPETFAEYFYSDIFNYVFPENFDDIANLADEDALSEAQRTKLLSCSSEKELKKWMDEIAGKIIMRIDAGEIIAEYLG